MPPKNKTNKKDIINAAFKIAKEEGFSGITARNVAKRLGCSIAPIYVNFDTINDLIEAVVLQVFDISKELLENQRSENVFENIGKASIEFARKYPVLFRELIMQPNPYMDSYDDFENHMLNHFDRDESTKDWTLQEQKLFLLKMRIFQTGLSVLIANEHVPEWLDDEAAEMLLLETGNDLFHIQKLKKEGKNK